MTAAQAFAPGRADAIRRAAALLCSARRMRMQLDSLPGDSAPLDMEEAYAVQRAITRELGRTIVGWKIGFTNEAQQRTRGVSESMCGPIYEGTVWPTPAVLDRSLSKPIAEAEYAFVLADDLPLRSTAYTRAELISAVATVHPAIELACSRYQGWPIKVDACSIVADAGGATGLVLGHPIAAWRDSRYIDEPVALRFNGEQVAAGSGAAVMGDPVVTLLWAANQGHRHGGLRAGQVITTGTCVTAQPIPPGVQVEADFGRFGTVRLRPLHSHKETR